MARERVLKVVILGEARHLGRTLGEADKKASGLQRTFGRLGGALGGALAGGAVIAGVRKLTDAARESQLIARQTEAVIKSTGGAAGLSAKGFSDLATQISKTAAVDDEIIQGGENILATFTKISAAGPDRIFQRASMAATDMAAAMGHGQVTAEGLQSANLRLGKALQDPLKGVTALTRVGVIFSQQQKDQIANYVKHGQLAKAQGVILAEVNKEFGGSAAAAATSGKQLAVTWGNMQEQLGGLLIPAIDRGARVLAALVGWVDKNRGAAAALGAVLAALAVTTVVVSQANKIAAERMFVVRAATLAWTAAQWLVNAALTANPIGLVIVAVAALVAGIIYAYKHSETFRRIVGKAFDFIRDKVGAVVLFILKMLRGWLNFQFDVVAGILRVMGKLPGPMGAPFRAAEKAVVKAKDTVNRQLDAVQARVNRLRGKDIPIRARAAVEIARSTRMYLRAANVPGFRAKGGLTRLGETAIVGEEGPELVQFNQPSYVYTASETRRILRRGMAGGGPVGDMDVWNARVITATDRLGERFAARLAASIGRGLSRALKKAVSMVGVGGALGSWIAQAIRITGVPPSWGPALARRARFESGGNPRAVNLWDINAQRGTPSMGLMQTIGPTFNAYAWDGLRDVWNPVHNLVAAIRYIRARYGSIFAIDPPVRGYDAGGMLPPGVSMAVNRTGRAEPVGFDYARMGAAVADALAARGMGAVYLDGRKVSRELAPAMRGNIRDAQRRELIPPARQLA